MTASIPEFFALFGLEPRFAIDREHLTRAYREVLAQVHPDRHAGAGPAQRRAAMQLASHANEAYRILKSDCARAAYLCRARGAAVEGPQAAPMDPGFLEQQMRWRETFEEARMAGDHAAMSHLAHEVTAEHDRMLERIGELLDRDGDYAAGAAAVRALMFVEKLAAEIDSAGAHHAASAAEGG